MECKVQQVTGSHSSLNKANQMLAALKKSVLYAVIIQFYQITTAFICGTSCCLNVFPPLEQKVTMKDFETPGYDVKLENIFTPNHQLSPLSKVISVSAMLKQYHHEKFLTTHKSVRTV